MCNVKYLWPFRGVGFLPFLRATRGLLIFLAMSLLQLSRNSLFLSMRLVCSSTRLLVEVLCIELRLLGFLVFGFVLAGPRTLHVLLAFIRG